MDQDSSNGSEPDKRNWRERLGIGPTEMPKLSDEFREETAPVAAEKPVRRAPQPVAKPAPMAPRRPPAAAASPAVPPVASRATPRAPDNAAQDALAEKLRAQRAAAEKLAEQRVQAARARAEGKAPAVDSPFGASRSLGQSSGAQVPPRAPGGVPPLAAGRPKFSFADDPASRLPGDASTPRAGLGGSAPLVPPRPALGGDSAAPPFLRPSTAGGGLPARPKAPSYRPPEPGAGYGSAPPRLQLPASPRAGLGAEAPAYPGARVPARRSAAPSAFDPYARQPDGRDQAEGEYPDEARQPPRLGRPAQPPRSRAPSDEGYDEVFDDASAPRQRATARDYETAYREEEGAFGDEPRRSSGPWLLLLALLAAALATGAVVWFYSGGMKNIPGIGGTSDTVPSVSSPETPAKVVPEGTADTGADAPTARKKQIYDRIVGDQEVTEGAQVQPTEEMPVQPGEEQPAGAQPAGQVPKVEPSAGATQIPAPDAAAQDAAGQGLPDVEEPPPLPVPPAGTGQEGSLIQPPLNQVAAAAEQVVQGASAPPPPPPLPDAQPASSSATSSPPPPEKATDGAALVSEASQASDAAAADAAAQEKAAEEKAAQERAAAVKAAEEKAAQEKAAAEKAAAAKAAEKKAADAAAKKKAAAAKKNAVDFDNLGSQPVVLVPPSQPATAQPEIVENAPAGAVVEAAPAPTKKKTIFDLFGGDSNTASAPQAETQVAAAPQQTTQATAPSTRQATQPQQASTGGGYIAQLASFRSDAEARQEYLRLKGAYPTIVGGLSQQIRPVNVGGSSRYQLALGPMGSRTEASGVCSALISAGESDCIVRGP